MTVRDVYEAVLVEVNKENAQSFTLEEFNYVLNKAILASVNEKYNFYAVNQQLSDDLRVFVKGQTFSMTDTVDIESGDDTTAVFNPTTSYLSTSISASTTATLNTTKDLANTNVIRFGSSAIDHTISDITNNVVTFSPAATASAGDRISLSTAPVPVPPNNTTSNRTVDLTFPSSDYWHLLSCRLLWKTRRPSQTVVTQIEFAAKRLTEDMLNVILNNTYTRPSPNRPYYQVYDNTANSGLLPLTAADGYRAYQNKPRMRIHIGPSNSIMELRSVEFDYLKLPEIVTIYDSDIFSATVDTSQVLELPDYLHNDIVKRCVIYLLEKAGDPRVQTQPQFNAEIPTVPMNLQMAGMNKQQQQAQPAQRQ